MSITRHTRGGRATASLLGSKVSAFRLRRHHLARRVPRASMVEAERDVCGVQAQVMSAAEIALWARVQNLRRDDVERALSRDRSLVKTRCMRATVHLLPAADVSVFQGGMRRPVSARILERWIDRHGLASEAKELTDAIYASLSGGPLTRKELTNEVVARLGTAKRQWGEGGWGGARQSYVPGWILAHMASRGSSVSARTEARRPPSYGCALGCRP